MIHWSDELPHDACRSAREWCLQQPSLFAAWSSCQRGDWMLWLVGRLSGEPGSESRRKLVGCAAECARLRLADFESGRPEDCRVRDCLDLCDRYAAGDQSVTIDQLISASAAAAAAYASAAAAYAAAAYASAASSYAYAAYAASSYAYAAAAAASAAASAAGASYASSYAYAASAASAAASAGASYAAAAADIVRRWYPEPPNLKGQRKC